MTPIMTQISAANAGLPFDPNFMAATVPRTAMSIEPRAMTTGTPAGRTDGVWLDAAGVGALLPRWPSLASTRLSISAPIRSTRPSASPSSNPGPSSRCAAAVAAMSSCALWSIPARYVLIRPPAHGMGGPRGLVDHPALVRSGPSMPGPGPLTCALAGTRTPSLLITGSITGARSPLLVSSHITTRLDTEHANSACSRNWADCHAGGWVD